jgi:eukaryotic-like serine/threonine-protein kinase
VQLGAGDIFAGDFRIERPLAAGGMGAVYVAEQLSTGRRRALKLMLPSIVASPRTRERFAQEARVASQIHSDHVVEVVAAGIDPGWGVPWLAMELLEGETLSERVARTGPLDAATTLEVFRQMCHALGAAHAAGLVHRDIKPDNLFLATPRRAGIPFTLKILDFGIAKLTERARATGAVTHAVGSPLWMAPEQTTSATVQPATDVWAQGLVAFYCLTGRVYWRAGNHESATLQELLREIVIDPIVPASARAAELGLGHPLPPGFDGWFSHTVHRAPSARYDSASTAMAALHPLLSAHASAPSPPVAYPGAAPVHTVTASALPMSADLATQRAAPRPRGAGVYLVLALALGAVFVLGLAGISALGFGYYYTTGADQPLPITRPAADAGLDAAAPVATTEATAPPPHASAVALSPAKTGGVAARNAGVAPPTAPAPTETTAPAQQPKASGVPAGWRPRGAQCVPGKDACYVNCCKKGDLLSPFPECACYFLPPGHDAGP